MDQVREVFESGKTSLGIEFGSTRIKAVLISSDNTVLATGIHDWENQLIDGLWTYSKEDILQGLQSAYSDLKQAVQRKYNLVLKKIGCIGISAMMHGYLAFDKDDQLLVPFRTWRNTNTGESARVLSQLFAFNIPLRWSIAHLYQAILDNEEHVSKLARLNTLAGYVHYLLTDKFVLGVGDASGMFPIDSTTGTYDVHKLEQFTELIRNKEYTWSLQDLLPAVLTAGQQAGSLTQTGTLLLDPSGDLQVGSIFCPPEGDAGTGMVATNSIKPKTGNISAGTSIFAMIVLEKSLMHAYPEIDLVTTPVGHSVAMVHANNCSTELNAWVNLFAEFAGLANLTCSKNEIYQMLFHHMLEDKLSDEPLISYPYHSGEDIVKVKDGCPLFVRTANAPFTLSNFMKVQLYSAFAAVAIGMKLLTEKENVQVEQILGHGGLFKTPGVAQRLLAAALNTPVVVNDTASEGGAWGMAVLANYINVSSKMSLQDYLDTCVFQHVQISCVQPRNEDVQEFNLYIQQFNDGLLVEQQAGIRIKE